MITGYYKERSDVSNSSGGNVSTTFLDGIIACVDSNNNNNNTRNTESNDDMEDFICTYDGLKIAIVLLILFLVFMSYLICRLGGGFDCIRKYIRKRILKSKTGQKLFEKSVIGGIDDDISHNEYSLNCAKSFLVKKKWKKIDDKEILNGRFLKGARNFKKGSRSKGISAAVRQTSRPFISTAIGKKY